MVVAKEGLVLDSAKIVNSSCRSSVHLPSSEAGDHVLSQQPCVSSGRHNKIHRWGAFNNRNFFSHSSGDWKSKIKVPADLVPGESSLPGLQKAGFWLCLQC